MKPKVDWVIHCCANGAKCDICGEVENHYPLYICNAHTHGMENYHHMDFQMVIHTKFEEIMRILNTMGLMVQSGKKFKSGDLISGMFEDCDVRLTEFDETNRRVLRVVIPDGKNRWPEDPECDYPYNMQMFGTDFLYMLGGKQNES